MTSSEWLEVCGRVADLWPNQPWNPNTTAAAFALFDGISARAANDAVAALAAKGREFAPVPGLVLVYAKAIESSLRPALPDPDLTRDLTPEEQARARSMAKRIQERVAKIARIRELAQVKSLE